MIICAIETIFQRCIVVEAKCPIKGGYARGADQGRTKVVTRGLRSFAITEPLFYPDGSVRLKLCRVSIAAGCVDSETHGRIIKHLKIELNRGGQVIFSRGLERYATAFRNSRSFT